MGLRNIVLFFIIHSNSSCIFAKYTQSILLITNRKLFKLLFIRSLRYHDCILIYPLLPYQIKEFRLLQTSLLPNRRPSEALLLLLILAATSALQDLSDAFGIGLSAKCLNLIDLDSPPALIVHTVAAGSLPTPGGTS